jgi:GTP-binding protein
MTSDPNDPSVEDQPPDDDAPQPVLAVVGRPNVGKSTLVNRILGRREAVVEDVPGVTRDRVTYDAQWRGRRFTVVDTGGWDPDAVGLQKAVAAQAEVAVAAADAVLFVVDATVGATDNDEAVVRVLRRAGKPVVLVANKVDDERGEADAAMLWSLGLGEPHVVSALHGRGSGDLLDVVLDALPETPAERFDEQAGPAPRRPRRPPQRRQVEPAQPARRARTASSSTARPAPRATRSTRMIELGRRDLALRRHRRPAPPRRPRVGAEYYSSLRTQGAIDAAEVVVVLLDASEPISEQDQRVIAMASTPAAPGARLQQVGPGRRGPPAAARQGDRPRAGPRHLGAARQRLCADRPGGRTSWRRPSRRRWRAGRCGSRPAS